jgi:hypothetical protein
MQHGFTINEAKLKIGNVSYIPDYNEGVLYAPGHYLQSNLVVFFK